MGLLLGFWRRAACRWDGVLRSFLSISHTATNITKLQRLIRYSRLTTHLSRLSVAKLFETSQQARTHHQINWRNGVRPSHLHPPAIWLLCFRCIGVGRQQQTGGLEAVTRFTSFLLSLVAHGKRQSLDPSLKVLHPTTFVSIG